MAKKEEPAHVCDRNSGDSGSRVENGMWVEWTSLNCSQCGAEQSRIVNQTPIKK